MKGTKKSTLHPITSSRRSQGEWGLQRGPRKVTARAQQHEKRRTFQKESTVKSWARTVVFSHEYY
jgi:hypothetical protein